jgi:nicotinate-nucleotide pyrophosphorylase (carboxylating)
VAAEVASQAEIKNAIEAGAGAVVLRGVTENDVKDRVDYARQLSSSILIEITGEVTLDNVRKFADAGADLIRVADLTQSARTMAISFQIQVG